MDEKPKERRIIMIKIVHEFNIRTFEDRVNEWIELGYDVFDIKIITNSNGSNATWIAILKDDVTKGE